MTFLKIASISALTLLLSGCIGEPKDEIWTGWVYPSKENTKRSVEIGQFKSFNECKVSAQNKMKSLDVETSGFFKCGLNCEFSESYKMLVCEEVRK